MVLILDFDLKFVKIRYLIILKIKDYLKIYKFLYFLQFIINFINYKMEYAQ